MENAKIKIEFHHSDGFGQISNESEWISEFYELKEIFDEIEIEYIEKWIKGEDFEEEKILSEDEYITFETTNYGSLRILFGVKYRAGGYDDNPVYRYDVDVYELFIHTK